MGEPGTSVRQSVPAELSGFIGRERELSRTATLLATARLVTLAGPAGIGKTRLAVRTVRTLGRSRGTDVVWADMVGVPSDGGAALERELVRRLDGREALLVLDGCEQLGAEAGPLVSALLVRLPGLRILATSQRAVGPAGEALLAVPPLAVPPPAAPDAAPGPARRSAASVAEVAGYEAVRLYEERARGADPSFELTEHNAGAVADLCRALDGIPGALELAAGRAHRHAPAEALRLLTADPLDFLSGGAGRAGGADALRTCSLAPPDERLLWDRLSVFAGSFDRDAVVEVCGFGPLGPRRAAEALERITPPCWRTPRTRAATGCRCPYAPSRPGGWRSPRTATGRPWPAVTASGAGRRPSGPPGCGGRGRSGRRAHWPSRNCRSCAPRWTRSPRPDPGAPWRSPCRCGSCGRPAAW